MSELVKLKVLYDDASCRYSELVREYARIHEYRNVRRDEEEWMVSLIEINKVIVDHLEVCIINKRKRR